MTGLALRNSDVRQDLLEELPAQWAWPLADDDVSAGQRSHDVSPDRHRRVLVTALLWTPNKTNVMNWLKLV